MNFNKPIYCPNYARIYPFEEYGDITTYFIKLIYYIDRNAFVSNKGITLANRVSMNDEPIFSASDRIDISRYTLLKETIIEVDVPNVIQVEEVYGYAPTNIYYKQSNDVYSFPAREDISAISQVEAPIQSAVNNTYDNLYDRLTLIVASTSIFRIGQKIRLFGVPLSTSNGYFSNSDETRIISIDAANNKITIENTSLQFYDWTGEAQGRATKSQLAYFANYHRLYAGSDFWYGSLYIQVVGTTVASKSKTVNIRDTISFSIGLPTIAEDEEKFKVLDYTGGETDTIDFSTTPSLTAYNTMLTDKTEIVIEDPKIENMDVEGKTYDTIYKKTVRRTVAQ